MLFFFFFVCPMGTSGAHELRFREDASPSWNQLRCLLREGAEVCDAVPVVH
jgi:hypothetical protein